MTTALIIFMIFIQLGGAIGLKYLMTLHEDLEFTNKENIKLLDGMHEGVLICHKG